MRNGERWDCTELTDLQKTIIKNREQLIGHLCQLGMIDETKPKNKNFMYVFLLGGTHERTKERAHLLEELIKEGYTFQKIVLLSGARPLQDFEKYGLPQTVATEAEMMHYVYDHSTLKDSQAELILVNSPMKVVNGKQSRPTTDDTFKDFLV